MASKTTLKLCPFCGGKFEIRAGEEFGEFWVILRCTGCGVLFDIRSEELDIPTIVQNAISAWERRTGEEARDGQA